MLTAASGLALYLSHSETIQGAPPIVDPPPQLAVAPTDALMAHDQRGTVAIGRDGAVEMAADGLADQLPVGDTVVVRDFGGAVNKSMQGLFDLVWEVPMVNLGGQFGLGDVGLRKICVNLASHYRLEVIGCVSRWANTALLQKSWLGLSDLRHMLRC